MGEPLAFGQLSMEVWAVSAPERTGEPFPRILVRPHSARPFALRRFRTLLASRCGSRCLRMLLSWSRMDA